MRAAAIRSMLVFPGHAWAQQVKQGSHEAGLWKKVVEMEQGRGEVRAWAVGAEQEMEYVCVDK